MATKQTTGVPPEKWGKPLWDAFHWVARGFPDRPTQSDRENYRAWMVKFVYVLPCDECKQNSVRLINQMPPRTDNRDQLFNWSVNFHNTINGELGAPALDLADMRRRYDLPPMSAAAPAPPAPAPVAPRSIPPNTPARERGVQPRIATGGLSRAWENANMLGLANSHHIGFAQSRARQHEVSQWPQPQTPHNPHIGGSKPTRKRCNCGK